MTSFASRRSRLAGPILLALALLIARPTRAADAPPLLRDGPAQAGDVALVDAAGRCAAILVDPADAAVVRIAADLFAADVELVTGRAPKVATAADGLNGPLVIVGTIGHSAAVDRLIADGKLDVSAVRGQWETFAIATVDQPFPGVGRALVVAGSDRRGTAFGTLELSEQIGVSPWVWWADSRPRHRGALTIAGGAHVVGPPTVKYRGFFINDEDWGLTPWAAKTFDPDFGNVGPKTYRKVFELMLRLKANYLWPAMHPCSTEFGTVPENARLADAYAIVMGASHAEPMNRNNVKWGSENRGDWNYATNRDGILSYWREWAKARGPYEAVWTVGIRGIHDSPMSGARDVAGKVALLARAIDDQRALLGEYVRPDVAQVPQAFMPYKEVLGLYQAGLKVPDDVTLVWCDDNYACIRQLSTPAEQARSGGSGVYFHASYLGRPRSYVWIDAMPPAIVWTEMQKALDFGADRIWVLNVGDLKPMERSIEFWARLAWRRDRYGDADPQRRFLDEFAAREFGDERGPAIASALDRFYRLAAGRRPELLEPGAFSVEHYDEARDRLAAYVALRRDVDAIGETIPPAQRDAFFELVAYPVRVAASCNEIRLGTDLAASEGESDAAAYRALADAARQRIWDDADAYNERVAAGKWREMVTIGGTTATNARGGYGTGALKVELGLTTRPTTTTTAADLPTPTTRSAAAVAPTSFVERDGVVSIEAEHFGERRDGASAGWRAIAGLGRSGDGAVTIRPANVPSIDGPERIAASAPSLSYRFRTTSDAPRAVVSGYARPGYRINAERGLRFAVAIDDAAPQIVDVVADADGGSSGEGGEAWSRRKMSDVAIVAAPPAPVAAGEHVLHVWMVDPGVVLDKLVIDLGGLRSSALGPPETPAGPGRAPARP